MLETQFLELVCKTAAAYLAAAQDIPVGVSNRHVHLSQNDLDALFGTGSVLHPIKALGQPGQFASEEMVTLRGPKGKTIQRVRVLGPIRPESQVEISQTDSFQLGISAPIRESGVLAETPGITLEGPAGSVTLTRGVIIAWRHIHLSEPIAQVQGVQDKDMVCIESDGPRGCVLKNVLVRVSDKFAPELHIDTDEANACGLKNGDIVRIRRAAP